MHHYGSQHNIGRSDIALQIVGSSQRRIHRFGQRSIHGAQTFQIIIHHGDTGAEAEEDARRRCTGCPGAHNDHVRGRNARHAAKHHASPAMSRFKKPSCNLRYQHAGNLAHRRHDREMVLGILDQFQSDGSRLLLSQEPVDFRIGGTQMDGAEKQFFFADPADIPEQSEA